jgi:hypothetical protein
MRLGEAATSSTYIPSSNDEDSSSNNNNNNNDYHMMRDSATLADRLFFQMMREAPIYVTRTKSMAAAYLTPSLMGTILGISLSNDVGVPTEEADIRRVLRHDHGIKSNYIHQTQWTGVSLSRWMDLFPQRFRSTTIDNNRSTTTTTSLMTTTDYGHPPPPNMLLSGLWLVALWETSDSKQCLLEFLIACDRHLITNNTNNSSGGGGSIFRRDDDAVQAILQDPVAKQEWLDHTFDEEQDLSMENVQTAMDRVLYYHGTTADHPTSSSHSHIIGDDDLEYARALEVVCASVALQQFPIHGSKPTTPNGYYGFDGGDIKADCTEVTVREIVDLLLWDDVSGSFDLTRLPPTASPALIRLYNQSSPTTAASDDPGKEWFDVLSDLPGCDYLASSSNNPKNENGGRPYELAPSMSNIARVLRRLFIGDPAVDENEDWTSLQDLSDAWTTSSSSPPLQVKVDTLTHQSSANTSRSNNDKEQLIRHEIGSLWLKGSPNAIEIRLRCDWTNRSGMAVVTHLRQPQNSFVTSDQIHNLLKLSDNDKKSVSGGDPTLQTLAIALLGDVAMTCRKSKSDSSIMDRLLLTNLLATPFGCDRRGLPCSSGDLDDETTVQEKTTLCESKALLKASIARICIAAGRDDDTVLSTQILLLSWILSETPAVTESPSSSDSMNTEAPSHDVEIEDMILSLPLAVLENHAVQGALERNWACRGKPLVALIQLESREASFLDVAFDLSMEQLLSLVALYRRRSSITTARPN